MATPTYKKQRTCASCGADIYSRYSRCDKCLALAARISRAKNPQKHKETARLWRRRHPEKMIEINRRRSLRDNYGITQEHYSSLLISQDGKCAICGSDKPGGPCKRNFMVDHNHSTGKVRGLLCGKCNFIIGLAGEQETILLSAISYLRRKL